MFAATTTTSTKSDGRSKLQQALDRESTVRTQSQEVGLDDGAVALFDDQLDPTTPIFRRTATAPRLFEIDLAGERARA
jgi:hypothetical protein